MLTRRHLLESAGALFLGAIVPRSAGAQTQSQSIDKRRRFVFAYFDGGWDLLLGLDPRDPATTRADRDGIETGYGQLAATYQARGVQRRGNLSFGPAVPPELLAHADKLSIVNGIGMDTASHEVGRRYFITGRFPRGITAVGSSAPAEIVAQAGDLLPIPNLSAGVEAYATGLPPFASALGVNSLTDLLVALTPFTDTRAAVLSAVEKYQDQSARCEGSAVVLLESQRRARQYLRAKLDQVFDLRRTDAEMERLRGLYAIGAGSAPGAPEVMTFVAAQAVKRGVSQCVSVRIAEGLDTHSNWAQDHAPRQERGWRALAALITDLATTPGEGARTVLDDTTILAFSEFGRTPLFNNLRGRDHFLGSSCLVAGAGVKKGVTIGGSAAVGMMPLDTELATGRAIERPTEAQRADGSVVTLSPKHVLATVLAGAGLDPTFLRTPPIAALLA